MLYAIIAICGILSFVAIRSSFYPLKWAASFAWWAFLIYWVDADILVDGTSADVAIFLLLIMLGMTFLLMGYITRKGKIDVEDEKTIGRIIRRTKYSIAREKSRATSNRETEEDYRKRVHKARIKGSKQRKKY